MKCPHEGCSFEGNSNEFFIEEYVGNCPKCKRIVEVKPPEYSDVKRVIQKNFPKLWKYFDIMISVPTTLLLSDLANPVGLILIAPPSVGKTTMLDMTRESEWVYTSDNFTPKAFVTHASNMKEEQRKKIDLLPKIKDKFFVCPELGPMFSKRHDDLVELLGTMTRVFDGNGLQINSGNSSNGYTGKYLFAFCGATTPSNLNKGVWKAMGSLGNRWLFLNMEPQTSPTTKERIKELFGESTYANKKEECTKIVSEYLNFKLKDKYCVEWDSRNDNVELQEKIIDLAIFISKARSDIAVWGERDNEGNVSYEHKEAIAEAPERLVNLLYNLARGHALNYDRNKLSEEDWAVVLTVGLSSIPRERAKVIEVLLEHEGAIDDEQLAIKLGVSFGQANKIKNTLITLGILTESVGRGQAMLNSKFEWLKEEMKKYKLKITFPENDAVCDKGKEVFPENDTVPVMIPISIK
jgi:hypothetical protein